MKSITKTIVISIILLFFIIGAILVYFLAPTYLDNYLIFIVGGIMCTLAIVTTVSTYRCNKQVPATLINYNFEQFKAHVTSSPIFTYQHQGNTYTTSVAEALSQRYILKHYEEGEIYTVWLCENNPTFIKLNRRVRLFDIVVFLLGLALMALSIAAIFLIE